MSDDYMRTNLVTEFCCSNCGTQLLLSYKVPKEEWTGKFATKDDGITGAAKVVSRIAIHPCRKCYGAVREIVDALKTVDKLKDKLG